MMAAQKKPPRIDSDRSGAASVRKIPAITDFRAKGTIMGLAVLTAVFGMGTGVTPPVWSPEMCPAGGQASRARNFRGWSHIESTDPHPNEWVFFHASLSKKPYGHGTPIDRVSCRLLLLGGQRGGSAPIGVVKLLGC